MAEDSKFKPIFERPFNSLKNDMRDMGYELEVLGPPDTLLNIECDSSYFFSNISSEGRERIDAYLNGKQADIGYVNEMQRGRYDSESTSYVADVVITAIKLKKIDNSQP